MQQLLNRTHNEINQDKPVIPLIQKSEQDHRSRPRLATSRPHEFLSKRSELLGHIATVKQATNWREVPRHIKSDGLF